jgi:hypothetical protein
MIKREFGTIAAAGLRPASKISVARYFFGLDPNPRRL